MTFMAAFGAAVARGGEHSAVFELLGVPDWRSRMPAVRGLRRLPGGGPVSRCAAGAGRAAIGAGYRVAIHRQPAGRTDRGAAGPGGGRGDHRHERCDGRRQARSGVLRAGPRAAGRPKPRRTWRTSGTARTTTFDRPRRRACGPSGCVAGRGASSRPRHPRRRPSWCARFHELVERIGSGWTPPIHRPSRIWLSRAPIPCRPRTRGSCAQVARGRRDRPRRGPSSPVAAARPRRRGLARRRGGAAG